MTALLFLALAAVISAVGLLVIAWRHRAAPWEAGIDDHAARLDALKPRDDDAVRWAQRQVAEGGSSTPGT